MDLVRKIQIFTRLVSRASLGRLAGHVLVAYVVKCIRPINCEKVANFYN